MRSRRYRGWPASGLAGALLPLQILVIFDSQPFVSVLWCIVPLLSSSTRFWGEREAGKAWRRGQRRRRSQLGPCRRALRFARGREWAPSSCRQRGRRELLLAMVLDLRQRELRFVPVEIVA